MTPNELRVGNMIEYNGMYKTIYSINKKGFITFDVDAIVVRGNKYEQSPSLHTKNFNAIPLTEEWLVKFGFEKKTFEIMTLYYYTLPVLSHGHINYYPKEHGFNIDLGTTSGYQFGTTSIKHVHQLQNLYFALTGEELTLNQ